MCCAYFSPFQCQEENMSQFIVEQQPVCDLQAVEKKFKSGSYTSVVSFTLSPHLLSKQQPCAINSLIL